MRPSAAALLVLAPLLAACDPKDSQTGPDLDAPGKTSLNRPDRTPRNAAEMPAARTLSAMTAETSQDGDFESLTRSGRQRFDGSGVIPVAYTPARQGGFSARSVIHRAGMAIDTDGPWSNRAAFDRYARNDPYRQAQTSLRYRTGRSLDPGNVPFIVLPGGYKGARLGDVVYVQYGRRGVWGIVGDYGPRHTFGEASSNMAANLGINPSGRNGGVGSGVTYTIFPGTGRRYADEEDLKRHLEAQKSALTGSGTTLSI